MLLSQKKEKGGLSSWLIEKNVRQYMLNKNLTYVDSNHDDEGESCMTVHLKNITLGAHEPKIAYI